MISPAAPPSQIIESTVPETCRAVVFAIAGHFLALPLAAVLKVIPTTLVLENKTPHQSLVYLDQEPITLINLHTVLSHISLRAEPSTPTTKLGQFLLITGFHGKAQWAIPVDEAPILTELSLFSARLLPDTYQQSIQYIATHVTVLTHPDASPTVLLMNLKQAAQSALATQR